MTSKKSDHSKKENEHVKIVQTQQQNGRTKSSETVEVVMKLYIKVLMHDIKFLRLQ